MNYPFPHTPKTDEENNAIHSLFFDKYNELYNNMYNLTHEEYKQQFKSVFAIKDEATDYLLVNTFAIEQREFEIFGIHWWEYNSILVK